MSSSEVITHILELIAGIGTFLVACDFLSDNLQAISSKSLKTLFSKVSGNKVLCVCIGALTTMLTHSSGVTNVMVLGFLNAEIITLNQAVTVILGSEIGTTLTAQIVALGGFNSVSIPVETIFASLIGIGAFIRLIANDGRVKNYGGALIGLGMIFVGLSMMSDSMDAFSKLEGLKVFLASIDSIVVLIIAGAILTALIQSSTAMTTIAITMIGAGLISVEQGIYITLGANVGSCVTGIIAALTSAVNAKRASLFQLMFNIGGVIFVTIIDSIVKLISSGAFSMTIAFKTMFPGLPQTQLAMFHTFFNISTVVLALPISNYMASLCVRIIPEKEEGFVAKNRLHYFDENMMSTPSIAVGQVKNEVLNMADYALYNFNSSIKMITDLDFSHLEEFKEVENEIDYLNENLVPIVATLSKKTLSIEDSNFLSGTYRVVADLERIGDYAENIVEYAEHLKQINQKFTSDAINEIEKVRDVINDIYHLTMDCYASYDLSKFNKAMELEETVDVLTEKMASNHIERMNNGKCNADIGSQYLSLASDVERIADHLININDKDSVISH